MAVLPSAAHAANPDSTIIEHLSVWQRVPLAMQDNPAMHGKAYGSSFSEVAVSMDYRHQTEAFVEGDGDGFFLPQATVNTFLRLNERSAVWGSAGYMNGKQFGIKWNSTSDYDLLEPYILADTVGGDTHRERYSFSGGYQTLVGKVSLGAEALFHASHEYRDVDPRMRGIVTQLHIRGGVSAPWAGQDWGLAFDGNIYKQTNDVDFYDELGVKPEYQMTGLGTQYSRFSGDKRELYYKGGGFGLLLSSLPNSGNGIYGSARLEESRYKRVLASLNSMPLTNLRYETADITLGWRRDHSSQWDVSARFLFTKRAGDEWIAGQSASTFFPTIGKLTMYKNYRLDASLGAVYGHRSVRNDWHVTLRGGVRDNRQTYVYPERKLNASQAYGEIGAQWIHRLSKPMTLKADINAGYDGNTDSEISMPYANMTVPFINMVNHQFSYASADYTHAHAGIRLDYQLPRSAIGLFVSVGGGFVHCSTSENQGDLTAKIGLTF